MDSVVLISGMVCRKAPARGAPTRSTPRFQVM